MIEVDDAGLDAVPLPALAACLARGEFAVMLWPVAGDVLAARAAVRGLCAALLQALPAPLHVSRSATAGFAGLALSGCGPVGIDVERVRAELLDTDLLQLALHADEWAEAQASVMPAEHFFKVWTRKEAVLKALGVGLAVAPNSFLSGRPSGDWCSASSAAGTAQVCNLATPPGWAAALACAAAQPDAAPRVTLIEVAQRAERRRATKPMAPSPASIKA